MQNTFTDYGSRVFARWRRQSQAAWLRYVGHGFVQGLGDGSLPERAFMQYLIQDYIFLVHYSRAWAMVIVKAQSLEQMRAAAATVNALINEEIQLHTELCRREGIRESTLVSAPEASENLAYTRYVIEAGLAGDILDLLAALAPCVFGYGEIGLRLAGCKNTTPLYRQWIDMYCGQEYQSVCRTVAGLVDQAAASQLGDDPFKHPRWAMLRQRFTTACELEAGFWGMGLRLAG